MGNTTAGNPFGGGGGFGGSTLGGNNGGLGLTMQANPAQANTASNPFGAFGGFAQPSTTTGTNTGSNLFGASSLQPQPQQQPSLTASVDQPFNSSIPVFELLPGAAALAGSLAASSLGKKKAPNFFQTRKALPSAKLAATLTSSSSAPNLRGFAASTANGKAGLQGLTQMMRAGTNNSTSALGSSGFLGGALSEKKALNSEVFVNSPGRTSVKKLVLDKEVSNAELSSLISKNSAKKNTGSALELFRGSPSSSLAPKGGLVPKALPAPPVETSREQTHTESDKLEKGDYWIQPSESQLAAIAFKDLEKLEGFKCGRVGYGTVEFLEPVNLTTIGAVKEIPGKFIIFDQRECTVYPDEQEKPAVGQGLNVPARITLENCWAVDRATREPIKDEEHPRYAAHLKKLKSMPNTAFEKFDIKTGEWTFRVEHFSRYGLGEDDDDEEMPEQTQQTGGQHSTDTAPALVDTSMASIEQTTDDDENMRTSVRPRDVSMRRSKEPTPAGFRRRSTSRQPRPHVPGEENDADDDEGDTEMDVTSPDQERTAPSWPAQLGMDPRRVGAMQNSLFAGVPNGGARSKSTGVGKALIKPPPRSSTPSALGKHPRELALLEDDGLGVMQRRRQSVEVGADFYS